MQGEIRDEQKKPHFLPKIRKIYREAGNLAGIPGNLDSNPVLSLDYGYCSTIPQNGTGNPQGFSFPFWYIRNHSFLNGQSVSRPGTSPKN